MQANAAAHEAAKRAAAADEEAATLRFEIEEIKIQASCLQDELTQARKAQQTKASSDQKYRDELEGQ